MMPGHIEILPEPEFAGCQGGCPPELTCATLSSDMLIDHGIMNSEFTPRSTLAIAWIYEDPENKSEIAVQTYIEPKGIEDIPIGGGGPSKNPGAAGSAEEPVEDDQIKFESPPEPGPIRAPVNEISDGTQIAPAVTFTGRQAGDMAAGLAPALNFDIVWKSQTDTTGLRGMRYEFRSAQETFIECDPVDAEIPENPMCSSLVRQPRSYE